MIHKEYIFDRYRAVTVEDSDKVRQMMEEETMAIIRI